MESKTISKYVYICYTAEDTEFVAPVIAFLRTRNCDMIYEKAVPPDSRSDSDLNHIRDCSLFVALITPKAAASEEIYETTAFACGCQKDICQIQLKKSRLPDHLELLLSVDPIYRNEYKNQTEFYSDIYAKVAAAGCVSDDSPYDVPKRIMTPSVRAKRVKAKKRFLVALFFLMALVILGTLGVLHMERDAQDNLFTSQEYFMCVIEEDKAVVIGYSGPDDEVIIPPEIAGLPVSKIGDQAFYNSSVVSVVIPEGVTHIGQFAFMNSSSLTSVTIPESVIEIGNGAFSECRSLLSVKLPSQITEIKSYTFEYCSALESVTLPEELIRIYSHAFTDCVSLQSIAIPDKVTSIHCSTFKGCWITVNAPYDCGHYGFFPDSDITWNIVSR